MKSNMRKLIRAILRLTMILSIAIGVVNTVMADEISGMTPFELTKNTARTEIEAAIAAGKAAGATVAIMDGGEFVYAEGFGMAGREKNIPVEQNTVFNIGSVSKVFAATSIMMLVDEGKVSLDKPVITYLPEFTMADERYRDITVSMLLTHSSGLPGTTAWNNFGSEYNQNVYSELLAVLSRSTLKHKPGELAAYCNDGFTLAEMIVAEVAGMGYGDFLIERIFKPLAMDHTCPGFNRLPEGLTPAKYYRADGRSEPLEIGSLLASGGLSSTAEDLCRFATTFSGGISILSSQSLREMLKRQPSEFQGKLRGDGFPFGLGWDFAELTPYPEKDIVLFGKTGGTGHYNAMLYTVPSQQISVAIIASGPQCDSPGIAFKVISAYLKEKGLITEEETEVKESLEAETFPTGLLAYEGFYGSVGITMRIALDDEKGMLTCFLVDGNDESALYSAIYNDGFFYDDAGNAYYFITVDETNYFVAYSPLFDFHNIKAEKIEAIAHPLELSVPIDGKIWLRRNAKAAEAAMLTEGHIISSMLIPDLPGYIDFEGLKAVKSPDYAGMPVKSMRDMSELRLYERDGNTWAWLSGANYMPAEIAMPLKTGTNTLVIGSEGLNEWLTVEFDTTLSFEMPDKGRVIIFSSEGIIYDSLVDNGDISALEGCLLEVDGEPGAQFQITASVDETAKISQSAAKISEILMADYGVNSLQYALLYGNKIIISGSTDKHGSSGEAVSSDVDTNSTIYGIGSTSKMFTAVAVMLLSEQGKINLDKPVIDYVPDFVMEDERYKDITVRMLLNHSSGLMGSTYTNGVLFDDNSTFNHDHLLSALADQKLKAEPGVYSVYCNDGFSLAEIVVERVSGLTFSQFVRENITRPLGLENTFTSQDVFDRELMAKTFIRDNETPPEMVNMIGSGGLYSTALELCLFGQIFMNNPENEIAKDFLSPASKDAMNEKEYLKGMWPEQTDNFFNYGLGWDSVELYPFNHYGIKGIAKGGDTQLYHSSLIVLPEQNMSFAVVMSGGSSIFGELMGLSLLQQTLLAEGEIDAIISAHEDTSEAVPMPVELTHYAGLYESNTMITEIKIEQNDTLTMSVVAELTGQNVPEESFIYYSSGKFVSEDRSKKISFVQEANGETYLHMIKNISLPGVGEIIMTLYDSVKISPNQVDLDIQQVWDERSGVYYLVNEMRSGEMYYNLFQSIFEISTSKELPGYFGPYRIDDMNTASQKAQIPVMNGRDNTSIYYIVENGKEYLLDGSWIYLSSKGISEIYAGIDAICTIPESGYAQWYFVGKEEEGKTMTVKLPDEGAFAVYDSSECIYYSTVSDNQPVMLPAEGKIVFIGDNPGTQFYITIK